MICSVIVSLVAAAVIYYIFFKKGNPPKKIEKSDAPQPYFYRHCEKATTEPVEGTIKGKIPPWLQGTLTRNGSGILRVGDYKYNHVFDGLSVLHRFEISGGKATYTSRPLESDAYKRNMAANRIVVSEFGTGSYPDPCQTIFQRFQTTFSAFKSGSDDMRSDNCSVNVAYYGDQLYAMTETNFVRRIDPKNLVTLGPKTRIPDYVSVNTATAHPHVQKDGTVLNMGTAYQGDNKSHYCLIQVPPSFESDETSFKNAKILAQIPFASSRFPCYYHSFGLTNSNKAIFVESPLRIDLLKLVASSFIQKSFAECMTWKPTLKTRFHVVSLDGGQPQSTVYEADPLFLFHHINAFEEKDGQLVVDVAAYPRGDLVLSWDTDWQKLDGQPIANNPVAQRFVLPLNIPDDAEPGSNLVTLANTKATATILKTEVTSDSAGEDGRVVFLTPEQLAKDWIELPRINYKNNGGPYNFMYGVSGTKPITNSSLDPESIIKIDIKTNQVKTWSDKNMSPSEPVFVPNPSKSDEDDGVLLAALLHKNEEAAVSLLVLDAKNLEEISRIQFKTAGSMTGTFHGQWAQDGSKLHFY